MTRDTLLRMDFSALARTLGLKKDTGIPSAQTAAMKTAGIDPAQMQEMLDGLRKLLASGQITKEQLKKQLLDGASKMGIPRMMAPMAINALMKELERPGK